MTTSAKSPKSGSSGPKQSSQQRLAAQRAEAARARIAAEKRRRMLLMVGIPIAVVLVAIGVLVTVKLVSGSSAKSGVKSTAASDAVIHDVTAVPSSVLDTVGVGTAKTLPKSVSAPALTDGGKPRVVYIGAEYCPFCAAERWGMVVALSRFGTFAGLGQTTSSPSDVYPSTPTLTFHGSTFTSPTVAFTGQELQSNQAVNGQYAALDTPSAADQALVSTYDAPPYFTQSGSIPFVDIGGKYLISGASYDPTVLQGKTHAQIAAALSDPTSPIAKAVDGTANLITAAICKTTASAPAAVCSSAGVQAAAAVLK